MRTIGQALRGMHPLGKHLLGLKKDLENGLSDDGDSSNWLDVLNQSIQTAGNIYVASRGGQAKTSINPYGVSTNVVSGSPTPTAALVSQSNTKTMMIGAAVLVGLVGLYMFMKK